MQKLVILNISNMKSKYTIDESFYEFNEELGIYSKPLKRYLKGYAKTKDEYLKVSLKCVGEEKTKTFLYHKVMWEHFNGEVPGGMELNHKDENKHNFKISNLEAITHSDNINYGTRNKRVGKKNAVKLKGKTLPDEVKKKIGEKSRGKTHTGATKEKLSKLHFKIVDKIDKITGEVLKTYHDTRELLKDGFSPKQVSACCTGFHKTHKDYMWRHPL